MVAAVLADEQGAHALGVLEVVRVGDEVGIGRVADRVGLGEVAADQRQHGAEVDRHLVTGDRAAGRVELAAGER